MSSSPADFNAQVIEEFRANEGRVGGVFEGMPLLLLHHVGAQSGKSRVNPLAYQSDDGRYVIFASKGGAPANPDWYRNLKAHPAVFDAAVIGELLQPGRRLRRGAKPRPAMHDHDPLGDFSQRQGPIDGGIAAARDDDSAAAKIFAPPDEVEDAALFERLDAGERRTVGPERAGAGRDDDGAGRHSHASEIFNNEAVIRGFEADDRMPEVKNRRERRGLFAEALDQLDGVDSRVARNVVDRLLGIERGALAARLRQRVEHGAAHVQHAAFEHREQPDRPGADDRDIIIVGLGQGRWHGASLCLEQACCRAV